MGSALHTTRTERHETALGRILREQGRKGSWLAEQLGITAGAVSRWANGEWPIPDGRVDQIAALLGVDPEELRDA
jgi:transcriptional regulator with XRE-family HTH domain